MRMTLVAFGVCCVCRRTGVFLAKDISRLSKSHISSITLRYDYTLSQSRTFSTSLRTMNAKDSEKSSDDLTTKKMPRETERIENVIGDFGLGRPPTKNELELSYFIGRLHKKGIHPYVLLGGFISIFLSFLAYALWNLESVTSDTMGPFFNGKRKIRGCDQVRKLLGSPLEFYGDLNSAMPFTSTLPKCDRYIDKAVNTEFIKLTYHVKGTDGRHAIVETDECSTFSPLTGHYKMLRLTLDTGEVVDVISDSVNEQFNKLYEQEKLKTLARAASIQAENVEKKAKDDQITAARERGEKIVQKQIQEKKK